MARLNPKTLPWQCKCIAARSRRGYRIGERLTLYWNEIMVTDLG